MSRVPILETEAAWSAPDLVCFSHLRWNFVFQRPQHILSRFASDRRVFFVEEPVFDSDSAVRLVVTSTRSGVHVVVPHLAKGLREDEVNLALRALVDDLFAEYDISEYVAWYYTPLALAFTSHLKPRVTVYDCMDELSAFKDAPAALQTYEAMLFERADLVFTGGRSLYEAKRALHPSVFEFPSSVDVAHFARSRSVSAEPDDQAAIPHPRIGYFGVIDERMDLALVEQVARMRPDWHLVFLGPVVKIDPATLPRLENIHYLGMKSYEELPAYLAGWDIAMLPFALNESTRFISPTKTPEYLAAGRPVVSTPIHDVVRTYGSTGLVGIAETPEEFVEFVASTLEGASNEAWLIAVDRVLATMSWDATVDRMRALVEEADGLAVNTIGHKTAVRARAAGARLTTRKGQPSAGGLR